MKEISMMQAQVKERQNRKMVITSKTALLKGQGKLEYTVSRTSGEGRVLFDTACDHMYTLEIVYTHESGMKEIVCLPDIARNVEVAYRCLAFFADALVTPLCAYEMVDVWLMQEASMVPR